MRRKILALVMSVLLGGMLVGASCAGDFGSDVTASFIGSSISNSLIRPM